MDTQAHNAEHELRQYVMQIRARDDPATASWVPSIEDEVDSARLFIADQMPTGDYELLQLASFGTVYSTHILHTLHGAELIVQMVGSVVSSCPPGGDDIAYISSAKPLTPYIVVTRTTISPPTGARHIPFIPLLKLATCRMTA